MKKLHVDVDEREIKSLEDIMDFERKNEIKVPELLREFLLMYEGLYLSEDQSYYKKANTNYEVSMILYLNENETYPSIEAILGGHKEQGTKEFIPFAIDSGGRDYCVSINSETYGQVWIDKFDSGEEDPMEFVTNSFEDFIDGLGPEV